MQPGSEGEGEGGESVVCEMAALAIREDREFQHCAEK